MITVRENSRVSPASSLTRTAKEAALLSILSVQESHDFLAEVLKVRYDVELRGGRLVAACPVRG